MMTKTKATSLCRAAVVAVAALILAACGGGGSGGDNAKNPTPPSTPNAGSSFTYSGPAPVSAEVQRFQQSFYNNLVNDNRCGSCHTRGGQGTTAFVDRSDINFAYNEALTLVNFENPAASEIVEKVYNGGTGHNCWEASAAACRVQMISYIEAWMSNGATGSTSVKLSRPTDRDPNGVAGGFRSFPADATLFGSSSLYTLVKTHCAGCHSDTSSVKQQPYFASSDPDIAYDAIKSKIDLNDPSLLLDPTLKAKSRLVVRLRDEFHNCWTASCGNDAVTMQDAIRAFAQNIAPTVLSSTAYRSKAQVLNDGVVGVSGGRFELYQIALWRFLEGEGKVVSDTSGISPAISLTVKGTEGDTGDFKWIGGGGIQFNGAVAYGTASTSKKLYDLLSAAGEYTIEAWTVPANVADEDREIIAYGNGSDRRNFMLGQTMYNYDFYNRSSATNTQGTVSGDKFSSDPDREALQANLQHVVATYDPVNGRRIYVDDELVSESYPDDRGTLASDWDKTYGVVMGNTLAQGATWKGGLRMVAIHKRALNPAQIAQNFAVKPGEKRYVMFNVSEIAGMPASCRDSATNTSYCYVYFEISQYDNYAYLFNKPHFISLKSDISDLNGLVIKGIRIGINGKLSPIGQAYVNVNATINTASNYTPGDTPGSGQPLWGDGAMGTVVPKLSGADADLLYLEFDKIASNTDQTPTPTVLSFAYVLDGVAGINLGWRTFDEINASFSQMTGVPVTASTGITDSQGAVTVQRVFAGARSQLPAVEDFPAYLASHQTSVTQLAIAYCAALMQNSGYRQTFFGASAAAPSYLAGNGWDNLVNPLVSKFLSNTALYGATTATPMHDELIELLTHSAGNPARKAGLCASGCGSDAAILNAGTTVCAAALANAALTLQ